LGNYLLDAQSDCVHTDAEALGVPPWEANPYGLVDWYEMEYFSAEIVFWAGLKLQNLETDCLFHGIEPDPDKPLISVINLNTSLDNDIREKAIKSFTFIQGHVSKIGLRISSETIADILQEMADRPGTTYQWLLETIRNLRKLMRKEMSGKVFFYISPEKAKFFPTKGNPYPFSEEVFKAFPSVSYDTNEAAWSLATSRSTAAVFHLMRILELGLGALGKEFGVSLAHTNWAPAIEQIESKIREMHKDAKWKSMPDCKEQQQFYADVASHFGILKDAWRNHTMHIRAKYTEDEAELIFANVRAFMQKLASRLSE
jgi:hypothetical protein